MNGKTGGNRARGSPGRRGSRRRADGGVRRQSLALRRLCRDRAGDLPGGSCLPAVHANPRPPGLPRAQSIGALQHQHQRATAGQQPRGAG